MVSVPGGDSHRSAVGRRPLHGQCQLQMPTGLPQAVADHAVVDLAQAVESKLPKNAPMHPTVYAVAPSARDKI